MLSYGISYTKKTNAKIKDPMLGLMGKMNYWMETCTTLLKLCFHISLWLLDQPVQLKTCRQVFNIKRTWVGNEIVDHSDVVRASPVGVAPTTSSFSTESLASIYCAKTTASRAEKHFKFWYLVRLILETLPYIKVVAVHDAQKGALAINLFVELCALV